MPKPTKTDELIALAKAGPFRARDAQALGIPRSYLTRPHGFIGVARPEHVEAKDEREGDQRSLELSSTDSAPQSAPFEEQHASVRRAGQAVGLGEDTRSITDAAKSSSVFLSTSTRPPTR